MTRLLIALACITAGLSAASAVEPTVDFNRDIRPILSNNCFACHGPDEKVRKADLRLDTFDGATGKTGTAGIVPGDPAKSSLIERVTSKDPDEAMPPAKTGKKLKKTIHLHTKTRHGSVNLAGLVPGRAKLTITRHGKKYSKTVMVASNGTNTVKIKVK